MTPTACVVSTPAAHDVSMHLELRWLASAVISACIRQQSHHRAAKQLTPRCGLEAVELTSDGLVSRKR